MTKILGLGGVTWDHIAIVERLPGVDEVIYTEHSTEQQGGMTATALAAVARLGGQAEFIGGIGDDQHGRSVMAGFERAGIEFGRLVVFPDRQTAHSLILVEKKSGKRTIIHHRGVQDLSALPGPPIDLTGVGFLHLDRYWIETALSTAKRARQAGVIVTVDPGQYRENPKIKELLSCTDYLIPSGGYARDFSGHQDIGQAARALLATGVRAVIVTLGEKGSLTVTADGGQIETPGFKVPVVDTTGAGDSFHGGFVFALSREYDLEKAVVFAGAVAALKCSRLGGQAGLPDFDQVRRFLKKGPLQ